jgi:hypothetical protein
MVSSFLLSRSISYTMDSNLEVETIKKVRSTTRDEFASLLAAHREEQDKLRKALTEPQSRDEFRTFIEYKGEAQLSDEQLARFDAIEADVVREYRERSKPQYVTQFQNEELSEHTFRIKEGFHEKRRCPVFIVQLTSRVERAMLRIGPSGRSATKQFHEPVMLDRGSSTSSRTCFSPVYHLLNGFMPMMP